MKWIWHPDLTQIFVNLELRLSLRWDESNAWERQLNYVRSPVEKISFHISSISRLRIEHTFFTSIFTVTRKDLGKKNMWSWDAEIGLSKRINRVSSFYLHQKRYAPCQFNFTWVLVVAYSAYVQVYSLYGYSPQHRRFYFEVSR